MSLTNWYEHQASKHKPVKGYGKGRRIEAPKVEPKPAPIEVQESTASDSMVLRILKQFRGE